MQELPSWREKRGTVDIALVWNLQSLPAKAKALNDIGLLSRLQISDDDIFGMAMKHKWVLAGQ